MRSALTDPTPRGGRSSPNARGPDDGASVRRLDQPYLPTRVRLADGRIHEGAISAERHRRLHLGLLHSDSDGYVEIAAGSRPPGGKLRITTRRDAGHFLAGGANGGPGWLEDLLALVARHDAAGEEVCVAPAVRCERAAAKPHVAHTNWLWIDVDGSDGLPAVRRLLRGKPAHLVVESAGSGGVHCYWRLRSRLPARAAATGVNRAGGRAARGDHDRRDRSRARAPDLRPRLRVARRHARPDGRRPSVQGPLTRHAPGRHGQRQDRAPRARHLGGPRARAVVGARARRRPARSTEAQARARPRAEAHQSRRPLQADLAGRVLPAAGEDRGPRAQARVCPNPAHGDTTPSCHVGSDAGEGWCCFGCGAAGAIYDLASVLLGGPTGQWLRGEQFRVAREHVIRPFGA